MLSWWIEVPVLFNNKQFLSEWKTVSNTVIIIFLRPTEIHQNHNPRIHNPNYYYVTDVELILFCGWIMHFNHVIWNPAI